MVEKQSPKNLTDPLRQYHVVTAALHQLGGGSRAVDTEDVAVRSFELAPYLFAWQKYPEQINLELVRVALSDAKKPKNGGLTSGSGRGQLVSQRDARALFRIDQYTTDEMVKIKIVRLLDMPWNDSQTERFLKHAADILRQGAVR